MQLSCPASVQAGQVLKCSVDSTFPAGTTFNLEFHSPSTTSLALLLVTIQNNQVTQYKLFDTSGLDAGTYQVLIRLKDMDSGKLSSDSVMNQTVMIIGTVPSTSSPVIPPATSLPIPTAAATLSPISIPTKPQTTIIIVTPKPTATVNYSATIASIESQIADQGVKIEELGNILNQITNFLRTLFGWK